MRGEADLGEGDDPFIRFLPPPVPFVFHISFAQLPPVEKGAGLTMAIGCRMALRRISGRERDFGLTYIKTTAAVMGCI